MKGILISGGIAIAATSPYFIPMALPKIIRYAAYKFNKARERKKFLRSFYYLRTHGFISIENRRGQIYISLTPEGKKAAGKYQINDLEIKRPKKWDGRWRILIFDIANRHKIKREALRGKIKQLGLYQLQKSVWVHPYDFKKEMALLREFFYLTKDEMQIITASEIENDAEAKDFFGLR